MALTRQQYLLTKLAEEASEVAQIALKSQQFGLLEKQPSNPLNNVQRIYAELNDLLGVVTLLNNEGNGFNFQENYEAQRDKKDKVNHYHNYSQSIGESE